MAKKQGMNLFEAHLEKIAIGAAVLVFFWVLVTRFISVTGIETPDGIQPVDLVAQDKADTAKQVWDRTRSRGISPVSVAALKNPTEDVFLRESPIDTIPLSPINTTQIEADAIHEKIANFPKNISPPHSLSLGIYHTRILLEPSESLSEEEEEVQDIDFVTVEGVYPLEQIRSLYQQSFQNPNLKNPVAYPKPIVAAVELQRSQLLPDGSWSAWQRTPRLDMGPGAVSELSSENFGDYSSEKYKAILNLRNSAVVQKRILQSTPYSLVDGEWLPPTEWAKRLEEESKSLRSPEGRLGSAPTPRSRPGLTGRRPTAEKREPKWEENLAGEEGVEVYGGEGGTGRGGSVNRKSYATSRKQHQYRSTSSPEMEEAEKYLKQEDVRFWAHDKNVVPGVVYRYQARLGFFNPIAGTDRFSPGDISYRNKIILWSEFFPGQDDEHKFVKVDKRVHFFPTPASSGEKAVATVEVFRQHEGQWYRRLYSVVPGSAIGAMDPPMEKGTSTSEEEEEIEKIDFRTGVTVIDVTSEAKHWYSSGRNNSISQVEIPDLVYRDVDGYVKRMPVDSRCWPQELRDLRGDIMKKIRKAKQRARTESPRQPATRRNRGRL